MSPSRVAMTTSSGCGCSCESAWACPVSAARSAPPVRRLGAQPSIGGFSWRRREYVHAVHLGVGSCGPGARFPIRLLSGPFARDE